MSWVAALSAGFETTLFPPFDRLRPSGAMRRGTLLLEAQLDPVPSAQTILRIPLQAHAAGHLSILALPGGSFSIVVSQGHALTHKTLRLGGDPSSEPQRMSFAWDCDAGFARFAVEQAFEDNFIVADMDLPQPMALSSLTQFEAMEICAPPEARLGFLAISNRVESIGPLPGLGARTKIETSFGARPLTELKCGDLVESAVGDAPEPVLCVAERIVPGLGSFAPLRLRAPYFGLTHDIVAAPHQKLLLTGPKVEYIFGRAEVLVAARHLVNGTSVLWEPSLPLVHYAQVLLPTNTLIESSGAALDSLFVGRLRRDRSKIAATLLRDVPGALIPEQAKVQLPVLKPYEAQALLQVA